MFDSVIYWRRVVYSNKSLQAELSALNDQISSFRQ